MSKETLRSVVLPLPGQHIISVRPRSRHRAVHTQHRAQCTHTHTRNPFSLAVLSPTPLRDRSKAVGGILLKHLYGHRQTDTLDRHSLPWQQLCHLDAQWKEGTTNISMLFVLTPNDKHMYFLPNTHTHTHKDFWPFSTPHNDLWILLLRVIFTTPNLICILFQGSLQCLTHLRYRSCDKLHVCEQGGRYWANVL